jgi:hypothetical protein
MTPPPRASLASPAFHSTQRMNRAQGLAGARSRQTECPIQLTRAARACPTDRRRWSPFGRARSFRPGDPQRRFRMLSSEHATSRARGSCLSSTGTYGVRPRLRVEGPDSASSEWHDSACEASRPRSAHRCADAAPVPRRRLSTHPCSHGRPNRGMRHQVRREEDGVGGCAMDLVASRLRLPVRGWAGRPRAVATRGVGGFLSPFRGPPTPAGRRGRGDRPMVALLPRARPIDQTVRVAHETAWQRQNRRCCGHDRVAGRVPPFGEGEVPCAWSVALQRVGVTGGLHGLRKPVAHHATRS